MLDVMLVCVKYFLHLIHLQVGLKTQNGIGTKFHIAVENSVEREDLLKTVLIYVTCKVV